MRRIRLVRNEGKCERSACPADVFAEQENNSALRAAAKKEWVSNVN
jgi:hypothetical protein